MRVLCLHTLRADCNAPLTPLRVALPCFASTRSVQIATFPFSPAMRCWFLCLHTLRADCNLRHFLHVAGVQALPPHAPCRLQLSLPSMACWMMSLPPHAPCRLQPERAFLHTASIAFASTRSVQIATSASLATCGTHLVFASTRSVQIATASKLMMSLDDYLCLHTLRADCNGRNAQNCNIHFFRTCVELVDSFSVLNKSMLR